VGNLAASVTQPVRQAAAALTHLGSPTTTYSSNTTPDADAADPANQMVTLGPAAAAEPNAARHIVSDTLTTDMLLGGAPPGTMVDPHALAYPDRSSLQHRPVHPDIAARIAAAESDYQHLYEQQHAAAQPYPEPGYAEVDIVGGLQVRAHACGRDKRACFGLLGT
jgi:hypothetical protein